MIQFKSKIKNKEAVLGIIGLGYVGLPLVIRFVEGGFKTVGFDVDKKKVDMLNLAVEAAHEYGLKLYGWMRFNSYSGNVQSDFYRNHPELHEEWDPGRPTNKLCLAHPEVRKHKIDILVEAASYGLDGLNLGLLRHPPPMLYGPILVEGFKKKHGKPPPPPQTEDRTCFSSLPDMSEDCQEWYRYRSTFMTQFGHDLRAALNERGMEHVKISLWLRPNHCLFRR